MRSTPRSLPSDRAGHLPGHRHAVDLVPQCGPEVAEHLGHARFGVENRVIILHRCGDQQTPSIPPHLEAVRSS